MAVVIAVGVLAVILAATLIVVNRRRGGSGEAAAGVVSADMGRPRPTVAEFHVQDGTARVHFEVPLPASGADEVLAELLGREAVEVVREKRHSLPIGDVTRVTALGRFGADWLEVTSIGLDTPGELPPPMLPEMLPHAGRGDFDPFEHISGLPEHAPGLAEGRRGEDLEPMRLRLPATASAGLRAQGVDPDGSDAIDLVLGLMRAAGYSISSTGDDTFMAVLGGGRTMLRVIPHEAGSHPEVDETAIRRFVVDFGASGADRGILLSEKWSPFEIYDRERRDRRIRFVTRERLQAFVDALALG